VYDRRNFFFIYIYYAYERSGRADNNESPKKNIYIYTIRVIYNIAGGLMYFFLFLFILTIYNKSTSELVAARTFLSIYICIYDGKKIKTTFENVHKLCGDQWRPRETWDTNFHVVPKTLIITRGRCGMSNLSISRRTFRANRVRYSSRVFTSSAQHTFERVLND